ncbi:MAG TPA: hypothetical protein DDY49_09585 [Paenibacillaceae bacterium]|nr:hypothetical protein [Paenibacillaceae bacterium]
MDEHKDDLRDNIVLDPLETPQVVQSKRSLRRLANYEPMPGFNVDTEDGEVDKTIGERLQDLQQSINEKKRPH